MGAVVAIVIIFLILGASLGAVAFVVYRRQLRRAKGIERGLKMVPIIIHLPPPSDDTEAGSRDLREVMREKTAQAEVLYNLIAGTAQSGFKSNFYGQRHIALELIATNGLIHFYAAVPVALVSIVEKAILTAYPGARLEEVEDHNIFNQEGRIAATMGGELMLKNNTAYPVATFKQLERDPMEAILNTLSGLQPGDGAGIQIMLRPAQPAWTKAAIQFAAKRAKAKNISMGFSVKDLAMAAVKPPESTDPAKQHDLTALEKNAIEAIEEKTQHTGYEVLIRVVVSTASVARSQTLLRDLSTSFALFEAPGLNGFKFLPAVDSQGLVTAFIFRFFPPEVNTTILNSVELATLFHLPDKQFTPSTGVERLASKQVDGPTSLGSEGLLFGYNEFRGTRKEIHLSSSDRRRHTYILGQTGTGKSTMLVNLAVQDMRNGGGFAFIDPHGDSAELIMSLVPKERAEDVVYFNPADTEFPLGLNLFEFDRPEQKDFLIQETIGMLTKLYDPNGTGVIGPRFEQWYRNAALTLMSDPAGSTFIEIPKVFSDTEYLKRKFRYLKDPTVIEFWTKEMGQTSDYHKSEMLGYFVSKFGAFQQNEMMRNIIGQTESAFNIREIMDNKKILIVNLSKGRIGELNARLLGMIFVIKIQAAAMGRADIPEIDRKDFSLYVDEFQNFSTDSFATILSEARKYRLNLIVANQFIGQLSNEIRDAVFGNVGTIIAHRMGPEDAEFMVKQFAPVFDTRDLVNIPNFHSVMRLMSGGLPSQPFSLTNLPPIGSPNLELGKAMMQLSAAKFGVPRAQVEADIFGRLSGKIGMTSNQVPAPPASAPIAPTPVASSPVPDSVDEPAPAVLAPVVAIAPALIPAPVPVPPAPTDSSRLSFQDITGPRPVPVAIPASAPVAPVVEASSEPVVEAQTPAGESIAIPVPPLVPEPEAPSSNGVPIPALIPDLIDAPPIGAPILQVEDSAAPQTQTQVLPVTVGERVTAPEIQASLVEKSQTGDEPVDAQLALHSIPLEPITLAEVVPQEQSPGLISTDGASIHDIPLLPPVPDSKSDIVPVMNVAEGITNESTVIEQPSAVSSVPNTSKVPTEAPDHEIDDLSMTALDTSNDAISASEEVTDKPGKASAEESFSNRSKTKQQSDRPQVHPVLEQNLVDQTHETFSTEASNTVAEEDIAAPEKIVIPSHIGRINHTRAHVQGLPVAIAVLDTVPAEDIAEDISNQKDPAPLNEEPEPLHKDVVTDPDEKELPPSAPLISPDHKQPPAIKLDTDHGETIETGDEPVPETMEEAQAQIEHLIDPDHHLHLFPVDQPAKKEFDDNRSDGTSSSTPVAQLSPNSTPDGVSPSNFASSPLQTSLNRANEQASAQALERELQAEAALDAAMKQAAVQSVQPEQMLDSVPAASTAVPFAESMAEEKPAIELLAPELVAAKVIESDPAIDPVVSSEEAQALAKANEELIHPSHHEPAPETTKTTHIQTTSDAQPGIAPTEPRLAATTLPVSTAAMPSVSSQSGVSSAPIVAHKTDLERADDEASAQAAADLKVADAAIVAAMQEAAEQFMRPTEPKVAPIAEPVTATNTSSLIMPKQVKVASLSEEPALLPAVKNQNKSEKREGSDIKKKAVTKKEKAVQPAEVRVEQGAAGIIKVANQGPEVIQKHPSEPEPSTGSPVTHENARTTEKAVAIEQKHAEDSINAAMREANAALTHHAAPKEPIIAGITTGGPITSNASTRPQLAPGEVFVDEDGTVHIGS